VNKLQEIFALIGYLAKFSGTANYGVNIFRIRRQLKATSLLEAQNENKGICQLRMQAIYLTIEQTRAYFHLFILLR